MSQNLTQASKEWATRPADERFEKLELLYLHTIGAAMRAQQASIPTNSLRVHAEGDDLRLGAHGRELRFNHWSFGQLARKVGVPADFLRKIPAELAVKNLNWGFENAAEDDSAQLWFDSQSNQLRAATGDAYARIKNHEVVKACMDLGDDWLTPPARPCMEGQPGSRKATAEDVTGSNHPSLGVKVGDWIAPAGIYGGDRNIFIFRVNPTIRLDNGTEGGLGRGFFVRNSEVGDASFELVAFWYQYVCGNHIVWGAEQVVEKRIKHVGTARGRAFDAMRDDLDTMSQVDLRAEEAMLNKAMDFNLGKDKEEIVDLVFRSKKIAGLTKRNAEVAFDMAEQFADSDGNGDPTTAWGYASGLTRLSQTSRYADERTALDRAAGTVLALARN